MFSFLKMNCLALYGLAAAAYFIELPWHSGPLLQRVAGIVLLVHCVEALVAFKHVKTYRGPLWMSLLLTLLYGLLHWLPLTRQSRSQSSPQG